MPVSCLTVAPRANTPDLRPTESAVRIAGLTKRFWTRRSTSELLRFRRRVAATVVDHVSFDVAEGEILGLLGPNGAGKTTIFKMLSTMLLPDEGTASVCGNDVRTSPERVREALAGVSSDERSLNWRLTARENLRLFAALHDVGGREADRHVDAVLDQVGLASTGRKMVAAFSSGMRQRLLIARALLARPHVLLLDEPTRALDPISAQEFRGFLRRELVERQRCTIVLATHNAEEALAYCDRIVVLNAGRVLAIGTASELVERFAKTHYRILTTNPDHRCFSSLETKGLIRRVATAADGSAGWHVVECAISADPFRSAAVLRALVESGVCVAQLERVEPSLADLIGHIISASEGVQADA